MKFPASIPVIVVLICLLISPALAAEPLWIVPSSPGDEFSTVGISQDGSFIVAGGDQLIALSSDGRKIWSGWSGVQVELSRDGKYITTSQGSTVRLFSRNGALLWDQSLGSGVTGLSITPDSTLIAAGGGGTVRAWFNSGSGLGSNLTETVNDIRISPVKDQIIVSTSKALRSYNLSCVPLWYDDTFSPGSIGMSGDGTGIVVPFGNHIRMYHGSGTLLWDRAFPGGAIISLAYSWDGSTIVAGRDDGTVIAMDRNGNVLWTGKAGFWVTSVSVSDDGSTIATGSIDNQVMVFNRQGAQLGSFKTRDPIKSGSVAMSGDGSLIVVSDLSHVYGFSRSGFTPPATSPPPTTGMNISGVSLATNPLVVAVPATTSPMAEAPPAAAPTKTPAAGLPWIVPAAAIAFMIAIRRG